MPETDKLSLIADITASYLRRNSVSVDQIGIVVSSVTDALEHASRKLAGTQTEESGQSAAGMDKAKPAVPIKRSVQPDHIVCLEDGFKGKTLKRHLQTAHDLTPQQYREKWHLPRDYPMVAPSYSASRSAMAKKLGLGRKAGAKATRGKRSTRKAAAGEGAAAT